jgi:crotonobetainyl-CoA:carnitine CoA-transferase CaiB-like acyl-CoA transferase
VRLRIKLAAEDGMSPQTAFEYLNRISAIAPLALPQFEGAEAVVPTPFRVATAAAASLGLGAAAAAEIWRFRGGERQTVALSLAAAAATLKAHELVHRNGAPQPPFRHALPTGFYHSADLRWLYLHGGFPHLALRTFDLLNARPDEPSVAEGAAKWNALALEDALAFMQLTGAVVRSQEEWQSSVQGRVLGPPIQLKKIGPTPPSRLKESRTPLEGFRVLDLTRVLAGPVCTELLASHGAEVLSVQSGRLPSLPALDFPHAGGKRRTELDLVKPAEAETLRRLARHTDIFVDSCRPGALARLGFSPAALAHIAPGMIYVAISAYGAEGPWAGRRGWEEVVQAATGLAEEQGAFMSPRKKRRELLPELIPAAVLDTVSGQLAAAGALAAVLHRIREGGSWLVQVSLAATAAWLSSLGRIDATAVPEAWEPRAGLDQYLQSCETQDGRFELLGPVVRMSKTPPLWSSPPDRFDPPHWASEHEEANAAESQPAQA